MSLVIFSHAVRVWSLVGFLLTETTPRSGPSLPPPPGGQQEPPPSCAALTCPPPHLHSLLGPSHSAVDVGSSSEAIQDLLPGDRGSTGRMRGLPEVA